MTSLVFDHALRIRLKAETANKKNGETSGAASPAGSDAQGATTPDNASDGQGDDDETVHSRTTTGASTATAASSATVVAPQTPAKGKHDKKADIKEEDKDKKEDKSGSNLIGKLNNLVTSDLQNITSGRDFLALSKHLFAGRNLGNLHLIWFPKFYWLLYSPACTCGFCTKSSGGGV